MRTFLACITMIVLDYFKIPPESGFPMFLVALSFSACIIQDIAEIVRE
jgi:hypothetical protein